MGWGTSVSLDGAIVGTGKAQPVSAGELGDLAGLGDEVAVLVPDLEVLVVVTVNDGTGGGLTGKPLG